MITLLLSLALAQEAVDPAGPVDPAGGADRIDETPPPPEASPSTCAADRAPRGDWPDATEQTLQERFAAERALRTFLFPPEVDRFDPERRGVRTDGVVVVHRGRIVFEAYGGGYTAETRHIAWSATKTLTNALVGIAVRDGLLALDDSICEHVEVGAQSSCAVTVQHLLEFTSGFDWVESYEDGSPRISSVAAMLYGQGALDMARFVTGHPLRDPPGTRWAYSSGDTTALAAVVGAVMAPRHGEKWPFAALLDPLGMGSATFERDAAGTYVGSSSLFATPRDLARFGVFLLDDGCWQGERLLPEGWLAASRVSPPAFSDRPLGDDGGPAPGRSLWLNQRPDGTLAWPSAPADAFAALGHWRQSIVVIPSEALVIVRTGDDRDGTYRHDAMIAHVLALIGEEAP